MRAEDKSIFYVVCQWGPKSKYRKELHHYYRSTITIEVQIKWLCYLPMRAEDKKYILQASKKIFVYSEVANDGQR